MMKRIAVVASHPIQYQAPMFRALSDMAVVKVYFGHRQSAAEQSAAGYGVAFDWDVDVTAGYASSFLENRSRQPGVDSFLGTDTPAIDSALREFAPDAVLSMGWNLKHYWQAARVARRIGALALVRGDSQLGSPRPPWVRAAKRLVYPRLLRQFDRFLPVGARSREYLMHYGVDPAKCFICPHTVDLRRFFAGSELPASERNAARLALGAAPSDLVVAFAGRFVDWKRPADLIDAVARLEAREGILCLFIGSGPEESALLRRARAAGVRVAFTGFVNQSRMPQTLAAADLLVLPSGARETWGLVANEALASGTPVLVSDAVGSAPDLASSADCCRVFRGGDVQALADALAVMLVPRTPAGASACREAATRFSPEIAARAVLAAASS